MGITWRGTWTRAVIVGGSVLTLAVASGEGCGGGSDTAAPPGTGGAAVGGHGGSGATSAGGGGAAGSGGGPACTGNETQPCYDGPDGTEGVGTCHAGTSTCAQDQWGPCEGQQIPLVEDCNTVGDEDCNGVPCSEHLWSRMFGTQGIDRAQAAAIDAAGNVAVAGQFSGTVDFGCGPLQGGGGSYNGFLVLYAAGTGDCLWDLVVGSPAGSTVTAIATDADGNILLTGNFQQELTVSGETIPVGGTTDGFLVKVDASGGLLWATNLATGLGASGSKTPAAVAVDAAGDIVLAGGYSGHWLCSMYCDALPAMTALFVEKHSGVDGHLVWRQTHDSPGHQGARAVAVEADQSIVVGGYFDQALDLGGPTFTAPTGRYGFLAKLASVDGATVWGKSFGDVPTATDQQQIWAIAIAAGDDIVVTGQGAGGVAFAPGDVMSSAGATDVFLARYTSGGDLVWRGLYGDVAAQLGGGVAVDSADNVILAGSNSGSVDFGSGALASLGSSDVFLAKFSGTGTLLWNRSFGGAGDDEGLGTAVDALGQIAIVGYANSGVDFGDGALPYVGGDDAFVAMFYP